MRICLVCSEYPPGPHGGIGTFTQVLGRALVQSGHEVRVVGVYRDSYPAPDYEEDEGVRVWRLRQPHGRFGWVVGRRMLFTKIARWSSSGEIELVEVPDWSGWAAGWPRLRVPVVARLNGSLSYFAAELNAPVKRTTYWLERASLRRADFWCSVSQYTAERTQRLFRLRTGPHAILYNPVETSASGIGTRRSSGEVVFTGTLTRKKGVESLARAWPRVLQQCRFASLHLYGKDGRTDDGRPMTQHLLSLLGSEARDSVHFHGHARRDQLFEAHQRARLAIFPSYAEAFALAPLEAMTRGCPTIATTRGSGAELIRSGQDGLLVDPDRPAEIAEAIVRLLTDDRLAQRLGEAGRRRVERCFSIDSLLPQNIAFYQTCLGRRGTPYAAHAVGERAWGDPHDQL